MKLSGKVAIITGAGSGIGRASALLFAQEGAKVIVAGRTLAKVELTANLINQSGGEAVAVRADVSKEADVENMVRVAVQNFGKVDILFNNAAVEGQQCATHERTVEAWDAEIEVDLKGVFLCSKHAIREMLKVGGGSIINTGSIASMVGFPENAAYCAAKAGVANFTRSLAIEYAKQNIRVNCICPGMIRTEMLQRCIDMIPNGEEVYVGLQPTGRIGEPKDIAKAALYMASDDSSYVTGAILMVDGGWVAV